MAETPTNKEHALRYPAMPVVVKTPALPTVACTPSASGAWRSEAEPGGIASRFLDPEDRLLGFALTGSADSRKQETLNARQAG